LTWIISEVRAIANRLPVKIFRDILRCMNSGFEKDNSSKGMTRRDFLFHLRNLGGAVIASKLATPTTSNAQAVEVEAPLEANIGGKYPVTQQNAGKVQSDQESIPDSATLNTPSVKGAEKEISIELERNPGEVPPSLMLHSRHYNLFPQILDLLVSEGYQGVTYTDYWLSMQPGAAPLPEKSIIISIDDLTAVAGQGTWDTFMKMQQDAQARGFPVVFAMNTWPSEKQDEERWAILAELVRRNWIEIASHGSYHTNLNNPMLKLDDYVAEVVDSTRMIEEKTGKKVTAFVTPFGSGYHRPTGTVAPELIDAAKAAGINFIVGILDGRRPLNISDINPESVYYIGRMVPGAYDSLTGFNWEKDHWRP
jgi:hypothetical protein